MNQWWNRKPVVSVLLLDVGLQQVGQCVDSRFGHAKELKPSRVIILLNQESAELSCTTRLHLVSNFKVEVGEYPTKTSLMQCGWSPEIVLVIWSLNVSNQEHKIVVIFIFCL